MGQKTKNALAVLSDSKARGIIIILVILALIAFIIGYLKLRSDRAEKAAGAALTRTPTTIRAVPGIGEPTREYIRLQEQQNIEQAQRALREQTAAIPTITRVTYVNADALQAGEVAKAGCSSEEIAQAKAQGVDALALRCHGCSLAALKLGGYTASELMSAGFSAKNLLDANFSYAELKNSGVSAKTLKELGTNINDLINAGYNAQDLRNAGFSAQELRAAKFDAQTLHDAGFNVKELYDAGFSARELNAIGYSAEALNKAGFTTQELGNAGIPLVKTPSAAEILAITKERKDAESWQEKLIAERKNLSRSLSKQGYLDKLRQMQQSMSTQTAELMTSWTPIPNQQYMERIVEEPIPEEISMRAQKGIVTATGTLEAGQLPAANTEVYKAGTILFATLDTGINSDERSPILATIVQHGPLKGAKVLGQFQRTEKKVVLQFNTLNIPNAPRSVPINAVAIDQNTARTAMATKVDNHYLLRYGTLFASSFVSGLAQAIQTSGSSTQQNVNGTQSNYYPELNVGEKAMVALGNVGQQFGSLLSPVFSRPPTVKVKEGTGIGLLLMTDAAIPIPSQER